MAKVSQGYVMVTKSGINLQSRPLRVFNLVSAQRICFVFQFSLQSIMLTLV